MKYSYKHGKHQQKYKSPNLVNQEFQAQRKNQLWFGDITYIATQEGFLYLSVFLDTYTRKCVGFSIAEHMRNELVIRSLEEAIQKEQPKSNVIIHSDQGAQYTSSDFLEYIHEHQFITSNSRKGNPYDNAVMESFFKSLKREVLNRYAFKSKAEAKIHLLEYLEQYYNEKRHHSALGYMTPCEFEIQNPQII